MSAYETDSLPSSSHLRLRGVQNFVFPNLPLPSYRKRDIAQRKMRKVYEDILKARRESDEDVSCRENSQSPSFC